MSNYGAGTEAAIAIAVSPLHGRVAVAAGVLLSLADSISLAGSHRVITQG